MKIPLYLISCLAALSVASCDRTNTPVSSDRGGGPTPLPDSSADAAVASGGTGGMVGGTTGGAPTRGAPGTDSPENRAAAPDGGPSTGTGVGTDPASGTNAPGSTGSGPGSR